MKARTLIAAGAVLLLAGTAPALAQMRGPGSGTSGMTGSMPGMPAGAGECHGEPVAFGDERPWVSIALAHAQDLRLARARTLEKGGAVLTAEQQAKLPSLARSARGMHRT